MSGSEGERKTRKFRLQYRFTIGTMLLVMLIGSFLAAAAGYLYQAMRSNQNWLILFFPFVLIAPMGLMILVSLARRVLIWMNQRKR